MVRVLATSVAALVGAIVAAQALPGPTGPVPPPQPLHTSAPSGAATHSLESNDLAAWLDGMIPYALTNGDIAGGVVVVVKDGRVLLEKGYGYADVARKIAMDPETTMVRIGSTSKLFTWTAVMQLVEQGKLDLDRDVDDYLDFKIPHKEGKFVTLRDLMNHKAGFEEGLKDILATDPDGLESTEQYLKQHPRPLLFAPGEVPAYSNYGASLAGYIVQRVSGETYEHYIENHILLPLGMQHTTFEQPLPPRFRPSVSQGYMTASGPPYPYELVVTRPAGSATATAADIAQFMIAQLQMGRLDDHQILSAGTAQLMQSPSETGLPGFGTMAHGFFYDIHNGRIVIGHGGDTVLFHTELDLLPQENVGICYTFNSRGKNNAIYGLRAALFDGFMNRYFPAPARSVPMPTWPAAVHDAQDIAGLYQSSRRVEHGFLSLFYLLQQSTIAANANGTITAPGAPGLDGDATFREVGPQLWLDVNGTRKLALTHVDGVKTVIDSEDPISVLQAVPFLRSAPLNLTVLLGSVTILIWSLVLWPLAPLLRRGDRAVIAIQSPVRRLRLWLRIAVAVDAAYLAAWALLLAPILSSQVQVYSFRLDPVVRTLQCAGLPVVAAACVGVWVAWRMFKLDAPWLSRIWTIVVVTALLGIVWLGVMGNLMSFNLNY